MHETASRAADDWGADTLGTCYYWGVHMSSKAHACRPTGACTRERTEDELEVAAVGREYLAEGLAAKRGGHNGVEGAADVHDRAGHSLGAQQLAPEGHLRAVGPIKECDARV